MINKEQYEVLKQLCEEYEDNQRYENSKFMYKITCLDDIIYVTDNTYESPDNYLKYLKKHFDSFLSDSKQSSLRIQEDWPIILDLTMCNGFGKKEEDIGKEMYYINNKKFHDLTHIKENDNDFNYHKNNIRKIREF